MSEIEVEPVNKLEAVTKYTDLFLEKTAGRVTDRVAGALTGLGGYTTLYMTALLAVNKFMDVQIHPASILYSAPMILTSLLYGYKKLRPIEQVNTAIKNINSRING